MSPYIIAEIGKNTYAVNECGMSTMYFLHGTKRGLLIDAGVGIVDIQKIIGELTELPYDVVFTHSHIDHIGSAHRFDTIYAHKAEWHNFGTVEAADLRRFADYVGKQGAYGAFPCTAADIRYKKFSGEKKELREGMIFDLGEREVEVIEVPGHTRGGCCFLDRKTKILFSGDACNPNLLLLFGCTLQESLDGLLHLKKWENRIGQNFSGHVGHGDSMCMRAVPERVLQDAIAACRLALQNPSTWKQEENERYGTIQTVQYGMVKISFPNSFHDAAL